MTHDEAAQVIVTAVSTTAGLAELTTLPTSEQQAAIRTLDQLAGAAPDVVCDALDLERGSTWGAVARELAYDVATS